MLDQAQLRKGTLEGCILKIIDREPTYGYAIAATLRESGFADLTEGTLYPLLPGSGRSLPRVPRWPGPRAAVRPRSARPAAWPPRRW